MFEDYLSLLSDPDDAPQFTKVYERYRDTVRAAALQAFNPQCDVSDIVEAIWAKEARQFHETKNDLLVPECDAYRGRIGALSAFVACEKNAKSPNNQEEPKEELTDFERLVFEAIGRNAAREWNELPEEDEYNTEP